MSPHPGSTPRRRSIDRRAFLTYSATVIAGVACSSGFAPDSGKARLSARPGAPSGSLELGAHRLGLGGDRDGTVYAPPTYLPGAGTGLLLLFHGAGGAAAPFVNAIRPLADEHGLLVLAPDSRAATWDVIGRGEFGADVDFVDDALDLVFERATVDPSRVWVAGFSDGGTYALSLGLINGDLFRKVAGMSPGYYVADERAGKPPVLLTHGVNDIVLPIQNASRAIRASLQSLGYDVTLIEYEAGHQLTQEMAEQTFDWLTA